MKDLRWVLLLEEGSFSVVKIWAPVLYWEQAGEAALGPSSLLPSLVIGGAAALPTDHQSISKALPFHFLTRGVLSMQSYPRFWLQTPEDHSIMWYSHVHFSTSVDAPVNDSPQILLATTKLYSCCHWMCGFQTRTLSCSHAVLVPTRFGPEAFRAALSPRPLPDSGAEHPGGQISGLCDSPARCCSLWCFHWRQWPIVGSALAL